MPQGRHGRPDLVWSKHDSEAVMATPSAMSSPVSLVSCFGGRSGRGWQSERGGSGRAREVVRVIRPPGSKVRSVLPGSCELVASGVGASSPSWGLVGRHGLGDRSLRLGWIPLIWFLEFVFGMAFWSDWL